MGYAGPSHLILDSCSAHSTDSAEALMAGCQIEDHSGITVSATW
jgi:hypothetical protein